MVDPQPINEHFRWILLLKVEIDDIMRYLEDISLARTCSFKAVSQVLKRKSDLVFEPCWCWTLAVRLNGELACNGYDLCWTREVEGVDPRDCGCGS